MKVTELIADVVVVGFLALVWIVLAGAALTHTTIDIELSLCRLHIPDRDAVTAVVGVLGTALAYAAGVVVDRLADTMLSPIEKRVFAHSVCKHWPLEGREGEMRVAVLQNAREPLADFLSYQRTRIRIARGTAFNSYAMGFAVAAYMSVCSPQSRHGSATVILAYGTTLAALIAAVIHHKDLLPTRPLLKGGVAKSTQALRKRVRETVRTSRWCKPSKILGAGAKLIVWGFLAAATPLMFDLTFVHRPWNGTQDIAIVAGALGAGAAGFAWHRIQSAYSGRLIDAFKLLEEQRRESH